jgi:uncharacterized alkaline shock family protein YloU
MKSEDTAMSEADETTPRKPAAARARAVPPPDAVEPPGDELGQTTIGEGVVTKVAGLAAREVAGVHELGGGTARAVGSVTQKVGLGDAFNQGVSVESGEKEAAVDLTLVIDYGESIPRVADAVRNQVIKRVEFITGLKVIEVNITVNDLYFPGDDEPDEGPRVT